MKRILVLNWKMNPVTLEEALNLARASDYKDVIIAPPFIFIEEIAKILKKARIGAQNLSWENSLTGGGAFTGEVSASELKNLGVEYVIIGHSERRKYLGETDEMINKKVLASVSAGLKVILCIGEDSAIRKKGKKAVEDFIKNQLENDIKGTYDIKFKIQNLIIAYEPVWAIGTGQADAPEDAAEIIKYIKKLLIVSYGLLVRVLYGGSVNGKDIKDFIKYDEIDGYLIGGASLKSSEVNKIIQACLEK